MASILIIGCPAIIPCALFGRYNHKTMEYLLNHIFDILTFLVALTGVVLALREYILSNALQKSKALYDILTDIKKDQGMFNIFYKIEYGNFSYDISFHNNREEKDLDRLLLLLSYACYLKERKLVSDAEFNQIRYIINRTLSNTEVQNYLYNVYHFSDQLPKKNTESKKEDNHLLEDCLFRPLIKYGQETRQIADGFLSLTKDPTLQSPYKYIL